MKCKSETVFVPVLAPVSLVAFPVNLELKIRGQTGTFATKYFDVGRNAAHRSNQKTGRLKSQLIR